MLSASCGEMRSSASRHSTQSCFAWSTANCFCRPKPSHSFCTTRARRRAAISAVESLDAESTTTISSTKARLSRQASSTAEALRVMRTAESGARDATFNFLSWVIPYNRGRHSKGLCPTLKVLFVKTSSLGDVVHNCPAVSDVARKRPGVEIDWVVEEPFAGIASMHASVRRVIPVRLRRWRSAWWRSSTWREIGEFRANIAAERYDAVIDTQSLAKGALISACAAGERHGMDAASARESIAARFYQHRYAVARGLHAVERTPRLAAAALGYELDLPLEYGLQSLQNEPGDAPYAVFLTM